MSIAAHAALREWVTRPTATNTEVVACDHCEPGIALTVFFSSVFLCAWGMLRVARARSCVAARVVKGTRWGCAGLPELKQRDTVASVGERHVYGCPGGHCVTNLFPPKVGISMGRAKYYKGTRHLGGGPVN
jgi:hypothetical protein